MVPLYFLSLILSPSYGLQGVHQGSIVTSSGWSCIQHNDHNTTFAAIRAWDWDGEFYENAVLNLKHASEANMPSVGVYMLPCRGENGPLQLELMVDTITQDNENNMYQEIWIMLYNDNQSNCDWSIYNASMNCQYAMDLIDHAKYIAPHKHIGIFSSLEQWQILFGSRSGCLQLSQMVPNRLWYANFNGQADFGDWAQQQFGGWFLPYMKHYKQKQAWCGYNWNLDWMPANVEQGKIYKQKIVNEAIGALTIVNKSNKNKHS
eukprot:119340_1